MEIATRFLMSGDHSLRRTEPCHPQQGFRLAVRKGGHLSPSMEATCCSRLSRASVLESFPD